MALLTIPSVTKGTAVSVTLNKTDLFALSAVAADSYFSDSANVKRCIIELNSDPGNQRKILRFDLSQASPSASLLVSATGRDSYLLERLVLEDYDGGSFILERSQLPSGLDIAIGSGGGGGGDLISFSGSAKTWGLKGTNGQSPILNATTTIDSFNYSIENGLMTLTYDLNMDITSGNQEIAPVGNTPYGIPMPEGWTFGDLSSFSTKDVRCQGQSSFGILPVLGAGIYSNNYSGTFPTEFIAYSPSRLILMNLSTVGNILVDRSFGSVTWQKLKIQVTLTNIPVVST